MFYENIQLETCDPHQLTGVIDNLSMQHRVLPGGRLCATVENVSLGHASAHRGRYGMGVLVNGAWPAGQVCVGLVLDAPADVTVNGYFCPAKSVQLYSEGAEVCYRAPPDSTWLAYFADRDYVQQAALELSGRPLPIPVAGMIGLRPSEPGASTLVAAINQLFCIGRQPVSPVTIERMRAAEARLLFALSGCLVADAGPVADKPLRAVAQRRNLMQRAEEYLRANPGGTFNLRHIAQATGCSERMLEYHFQRAYGLTPQAWFRAMKLNAAHQQLLHAGGSGAAVSKIALHWGFNHLGRFSMEYKKLFGESPRDTVRRQWTTGLTGGLRMPFSNAPP